MLVHLARDRLNCVLDQLPKLRQHRLYEVNLYVHRVEVLLELGIRQLHAQAQLALNKEW